MTISTEHTSCLKLEKNIDNFTSGFADGDESRLSGFPYEKRNGAGGAYHQEECMFRCIGEKV